MLCSFHSHVTSSLLGPNIHSISTLLSNTLPQNETPSFTDIQNNRQNYSSINLNLLFLDTRLQDKSILAYNHIITMQVVQHIKVYLHTITSLLCKLYSISKYTCIQSHHYYASCTAYQSILAYNHTITMQVVQHIKVYLHTIISLLCKLYSTSKYTCIQSHHYYASCTAYQSARCYNI